MAAALVQTVRAAIVLVQHNDDCPVWLATIQPLKNYVDNLPDAPVHIVTNSVLCFKDARDRQRYARSQGDAPGTSVWTVMRPLLQHRSANIPRLFLCASQYQTTGIADAADQWHCVVVMKLNEHWHIYTTGGVREDEVLRGATRISGLQGMAVVQHFLRTFVVLRATVYVRDGQVGHCVRESLEVILGIFEAAVIRGLEGDEIVRHMMNGRRAVVVSK